MHINDVTKKNFLNFLMELSEIFPLEIDGRNMIIELEQRTTRRKVSNGKSHNGFSSSRRGNVVVTVLIVIFFLVMSQILRSFSHCKLSKCYGNRVCLGAVHKEKLTFRFVCLF